MKLLENNSVYVQAKDLILLFNTDNIVPFSVWGTALSNSNWAKKGHDFDFIEFNSDLIDYFNDQNWIINFNEFKDLDVKVIKRVIKNHEKILHNLDSELDKSRYDKEKNIIFDLKMIVQLKNMKRVVTNKISQENSKQILSKKMLYLCKK